MRPPCADRALCRAGACPSLGAARVTRRWNDLRGGSGRQAQTRTWAIWIAPCSVGVVSSLFPVSERSVSRTVGNAETQHPCGFAGGCCLCSQVPIHSHSLREHGGLNDVQYSGSRGVLAYRCLDQWGAVRRLFGSVRATKRRCEPVQVVEAMRSLFPYLDRSVSRTVGNAETQHPYGFAGGCCLCSQVPIHSHSLREHGA